MSQFLRLCPNAAILVQSSKTSSLTREILGPEDPESEGIDKDVEAMLAEAAGWIFLPPPYRYIEESFPKYAC